MGLVDETHCVNPVMRWVCM